MRLRVEDVPDEGSIVVGSVGSSSADLYPADNVEMEIRHERAALPGPQHALYLPLLAR